MRQVMFSTDEIKAKIANGETLLLAGDEKMLRQLPAGNWIGGTIPYFMAESGGLFSQERVFVTKLPEYVTDLSIQAYDETNLAQVYLDMPDNGFSIIIIPANSSTHLSFALNAHSYAGFATRPLIGWIAGVDLDDLGKVQPKVFNGRTTEVLENQAIVMHVTLAADKIAEIGILNIFEQGDSDVLMFPEDGFSADSVLVNGEEQNFAEYLSKRQANVQLPLVADYYGVSINISLQSVDAIHKQVQFYAPVFRGVQYKLAQPVGDYMAHFSTRLPKAMDGQVVFSCNCILNYLYSQLEGKQTGTLTGPFTFGEIAYQLLNQTLVYLSIWDI